MNIKDDDFDGDEDGNGDNAMIENAIWRAQGRKDYFERFSNQVFFEEKDCDDEDQK